MNVPSEDAAERARKYMEAFEKALRNFNPTQGDAHVKGEGIKRVSDALHRYLQDAHYYLANDKPTTALASIAYAEGLLDALTFLELTKPESAE